MKASPGSWASERSAGSGWGLHPIGAIFSSCFIEHISGGGTFVDKTMYCAESSDLIASVIIYLCGFVLFFRRAMTVWLDRVIEKREAAMLLCKEGDKE